MDNTILLGILTGIGLLLLLVLIFKIHAFLSLLIASIVTAGICGLDSKAIIDTIQQGMGSTLGFVATVVGLGAIFGAILEYSGGAQSIAVFLTQKAGTKKAPAALAITGFLVSIPVFFDVAFIILIPLIYALQQRTGKSLLAFAIPLLAGLATTHAFVPPTPGPVAVAEILKAELGWVILAGILCGIPTVLVSGIWFGKIIAQKIHIGIPEDHVPMQAPETAVIPPDVSVILLAILFPLVLIVMASMIGSGWIPVPFPGLKNMITLIGHPIVALILANLSIWYFLGIRRGVSKDILMSITSRSMAPAGTIILLTGAGGVFKQVLVNTGGGEMIAKSMQDAGLPVILFAFIAAALIRMAQGSATVAMITAAGLVSPLVTAQSGFSAGQLAALVIAIASGASIMSHVNDSGFWLVKQYLGMTEAQTFRSWTLMTTILALTGFLCSAILFWLL